MAVTPLAGKNGTVTLATVAYAFGKWSGTIKHDVIDVSNSGGAGARSRITGLQSFDGSFEGPLDTTLAIYKQAAVSSGASMAAVFGMDAATHTIACNIVVEDCELTTDIEGAVTYKVSFKSDGALTLAP